MVASTGINEQLLEASCKLKADVDARLCILQEKGTVSSWCTSVLVAS